MLPYFSPENGNILFYGFKKNNIVFNKESSSWQIVEDSRSVEDLLKSGNQVLSTKVVGTLKLHELANHMPVGKHLWSLTDRCNQMMPLKLTHVSISFFFLRSF